MLLRLPIHLCSLIIVSLKTNYCLLQQCCSVINKRKKTVKQHLAGFIRSRRVPNIKFLIGFNGILCRQKASLLVFVVPSDCFQLIRRRNFLYLHKVTTRLPRFITRPLIVRAKVVRSLAPSSPLVSLNDYNYICLSNYACHRDRKDKAGDESFIFKSASSCLPIGASRFPRH